MSNVVEMKDGLLLVTKDVLAEVTTDGSDAPMRAMVSTEAVDSDGDIIRQGRNKRGAGWLLDRFNKAPVMSWQHDLRIPNISAPGTRAKVMPRGDGEKGRALFLDPMMFDVEDPFAAAIESKYRRKVLKETSVGFVGRVRDSIKGEEGRITGIEFFEQELLEVAAANRGANPETQTMVKRLLGNMGIIEKIETHDDAEASELRDEIADLNEKVALLTRTIKSLGDQVTACDEAVHVIQKERDQSVLRAKAVAELHRRLESLGLAR